MRLLPMRTTTEGILGEGEEMCAKTLREGEGDGDGRVEGGAR